MTRDVTAGLKLIEAIKPLSSLAKPDDSKWVFLESLFQFNIVSIIDLYGCSVELDTFFSFNVISQDLKKLLNHNLSGQCHLLL